MVRIHLPPAGSPLRTYLAGRCRPPIDEAIAERSNPRHPWAAGWSSCGQRGAFTGSPCRLCKLGARSHEFGEIDLCHFCTGPLGAAGPRNERRSNAVLRPDRTWRRYCRRTRARALTCINRHRRRAGYSAPAAGLSIGCAPGIQRPTDRGSSGRALIVKSQAISNAPIANTTSPGSRIHCQNKVES